MVSYIISGNAPCLFSEDRGLRLPTPSTVRLGSPHLQPRASFAVLEEGSAFEETLALSAVTGKLHSGLASPRLLG